MVIRAMLLFVLRPDNIVCALFKSWRLSKVTVTLRQFNVSTDLVLMLYLSLQTTPGNETVR